MAIDYNKFFLDKIKEDEKLNSFLKELTEEQIEDNLLVLYHQALDNEKCAKCLGKEKCTRDEEYYQSYLTLSEGKVIKSLTPCEYVPTYNFDLVDVMYMPKDALNGELYKEQERNNVFQAIANFDKGLTKKGTYLYGKYGTGKSFITYKYVSKLAKEGKKVIFCFVPELIRNIKNNINEYGYIDKILVKLKYTDILVLDDLGGELNSVFSRDDILNPILDFRMCSSKPVFITSNLSYEALEEHFSDGSGKIDVVAAGRIMERIRALTNPVELKDVNYRHEDKS